MLINIGEWAWGIVADSYGKLWEWFETLLESIGMYETIFGLVSLAVAVCMFILPLRGSGLVLRLDVGKSDKVKKVSSGNKALPSGRGKGG